MKIAIIGQGIAGTLLHYQLKLKGVKSVIYDNNELNSASKVAAGVVNPISGRHFLLSWKYPELEKSFLKIYKDIAALLGIEILKQKKIARIIDNIGLENTVFEKAQNPEFSQYFDLKHKMDSLSQSFNPYFSAISINGYQLDTNKFLEKYREYLLANDEYCQVQFSSNQFESLENGKVSINNEEFDHVVFCEGASAIDNSFFNYLPFNLSKGEVLIVKIPGLQIDYLLKNKLYFVNQGDDIYWIGSGYDKNYIDDKPTPSVKLNMVKQLDELLKIPYEIIAHKAAVRPTVRHRKPLLGTHPQFNNLHIFNGLGTKGSMLGPYFSTMMADYMVDEKPLDEEVCIDNYNKL
jgi:glycine/D-amino acid oxidase-like deaminating enzyme